MAWTALALLLLVAVVVYFYLHAPVRQVRQAAQLVRTSDGDTVVLRTQNGRQVTVRLYGIDTPELGTAAAFRAALYSSQELESARRIEFEPEGHTARSGKSGIAYDKYGRILGWVWYEDRQGYEHLLNEELVREHLAVLYHKSPQGLYGERLWRAARR